MIPKKGFLGSRCGISVMFLGLNFGSRWNSQFTCLGHHADRFCGPFACLLEQQSAWLVDNRLEGNNCRACGCTLYTLCKETRATAR
jgi:hypothetical protein